VIITPEPGMQKEIGQKLLALAEHPRDVQWVTWPQAGYSIPLALFVKFDSDTVEPGHIEAADDARPPDAPRRRGRPRREPSTDNNTSEEE
jgi:hypothetical protein